MSNSGLVAIYLFASLAIAACGAGIATSTAPANASQTTSLPAPSPAAAIPTPGATTRAADICAGREQALGWDAVPQVVRRLGDAWMAPTQTTRLAILDEIWAEQGLYVNQFDEAPVVGRAAVADYMAYGMADNYLEISAWDSADMHNDRIRIRWRDCCPEGGVLLTVTEFAELDSAGRYSRVTSFWDHYIEEVAGEACD